MTQLRLADEYEQFVEKFKPKKTTPTTATRRQRFTRS